MNNTGKDIIIVDNRSNNLDGHVKVKEQQKRQCCKCHCCNTCLWMHHPLPENATWRQKCNYSFMCPPHGIVGYIVTSVIAVALLWGTTWSILQDEAFPGNNIFALIVLYVACNIGGILFEIIKLPGLLGKSLR